MSSLLPHTIISWRSAFLHLYLILGFHMYLFLFLNSLLHYIALSIQALLSGSFNDYSFISQYLIEVVPSHHFLKILLFSGIFHIHNYMNLVWSCHISKKITLDIFSRNTVIMYIKLGRIYIFITLVLLI